MKLINRVRQFFRMQDKPAWASQCNAVYTDRSGRVYYQYADELNMCVSRKGEIDKCLMELNYGRDYTDVFKGIQSLLSKADKRGNMKPDIEGVGYLAQEVIDRSKYLVVPEILMRICANTLIREDENPYIVDDEILNQKLTTFKNEIQRGGLHVFFHSTGLLKYLNLSDMSISEFNKNMIDSEMMLEQHERIKAFILDRR